MEVPVKNQKGDIVDTINLDNAIFNVPMNQSLVHQALVIYQDNKRQGTNDTKTRAEVSGGGRKPWIQKHTGRARQGSTRAPQWRHGGIAFGPHPRDYHKALPRRMRRQAVKCALSEKARRGHLVCLDSLEGMGNKTKSMAELLDNLGVTGSILLVTQEPEEGVIRAARNLKNIWTLPVNLLNAHDLLRRETLIMTVAAARRAEDLWAKNPYRGWRSARPAAAAGVAVNTPGPAAGETSSAPERPRTRQRRRTPGTGEGAEQ
jgi:large subunit ribosomal protein L4